MYLLFIEMLLVLIELNVSIHVYICNTDLRIYIFNFIRHCLLNTTILLIIVIDVHGTTTEYNY